MNEIVNKFLLARDKFMSEMHLKQLDLLRTKSLKIYANRNANYFYKNDLDKVFFQYDMAYGDFKYLTRRSASVKL